MMSHLAPTTAVTPCLTRGKAFPCNLSTRRGVGEGSQAPDQVRGDEAVFEGQAHA